MKKIVIVSSTFRKNGNSELLAKQFEKGAQESGNSVQTIFLRDVKPKFCTGCLSCLNTGKCVLKDGVNALLPAVREADVLVFCNARLLLFHERTVKDISRQAESSLRRRKQIQRSVSARFVGGKRQICHGRHRPRRAGLDRLFQRRAPCGHSVRDRRGRGGEHQGDARFR